MDDRAGAELQQAEQAALGAMLQSERAIEQVTDILSSRDFYDTRHATIYTAIITRWAAGQPVDGALLTAHLAQTEELHRVGGAPYLLELLEAVPTVANATHYARIVAQAAGGRRIAEAAAQLDQAARIPDPDSRARRVETILGALTSTRISEAVSWQPIDLGPYLRGEVVRPEPTVGVVRSDGLRSIYPSKEHAVIGEMEAGKSWWCLGCVCAELDAGHHVVYMHFEEADPADTVERLQALGARDEDLLRLLRFVGPDRPVTADALRRLLDPAPSLVVIDGVNEAMAMNGWGIREEDGAAAFRRHLVKPCTATGAAVLSADHVVKDKESRGRYALGSIHKGNALSGSLIVLENADPFGRGQRGRSHVFVTKDRPGHLRRNGQGTKTSGKTYLGEMVVDDTRRVNPWLELGFYAPTGQPSARADAANLDDEKVLETVVAIIKDGNEANVRTVRAAARMANTRTADSLTRLVMGGQLKEVHGPNNSKIYIPGGSDEDL